MRSNVSNYHDFSYDSRLAIYSTTFIGVLVWLRVYLHFQQIILPSKIVTTVISPSPVGHAQALCIIGAFGSRDKTVLAGSLNQICAHSIVAMLVRTQARNVDSCNWIRRRLSLSALRMMSCPGFAKDVILPVSFFGTSPCNSEGVARISSTQFFKHKPWTDARVDVDKICLIPFPKFFPTVLVSLLCYLDTGVGCWI